MQRQTIARVSVRIVISCLLLTAPLQPVRAQASANFLTLFSVDNHNTKQATLAITAAATGVAALRASHGVFADFNGDGFDDLAIAVPGEDMNQMGDTGAVNVVYGSAGVGLTDSGNQFWHQNSLTILDSAEVVDRFGDALTAGDFDNDGFDDLAIGVRDEDIKQIFGAGIFSAGAVNVVYGSAGVGLTDSDNQLWHQDSLNILDSAEAFDQFGGIYR